jgi:glycosyltransferase involved in cell wall biosynthesis
MISVLILTRNEEHDLPGCLASVAWSDDVVVYDSCSTDRTAAIAREAGARVFERAFDNYASQRNHALRDVSFRHPWVYLMDADERIPADLRDEMLAAVRAAPEDVAVFRLRRKDMFFGRWLRRSSGYPTWAPRLVRPARVWVEREINEQLQTKDQVRNLRGHFIHLPFSKGVAFWIERHNRYSTMEAEALVQETRVPLRWRGLFGRDPAVRRRHLKQLAYRLPCRPLLAFLYFYGVRLGFLDGAAGWHYCRLRALYEYMIEIKMREARHRARACRPEEEGCSHEE